MNCQHKERSEIVHLCNIRHNADNSHKTCDTEYCRYERDDCPHIFAYQVCECGQKFVGPLGEWYKDTTEYLEEKI